MKSPLNSIARICRFNKSLNSELRVQSLVKHLVHRITDQDPGICRYYCAYRSLTVVAAQHLDTASIPVPPNSY